MAVPLDWWHPNPNWLGFFRLRKLFFSFFFPFFFLSQLFLNLTVLFFSFVSWVVRGEGSFFWVVGFAFWVISYIHLGGFALLRRSMG